MAEPTLADLVTYLDDRLTAVLAAPGMWGDPLAVELQVLQLVDVRHFACGGEDLAKDTNRRYVAYLTSQLGRGNQPLSVRLGCKDRETKRFIELLGLFIAQEKAMDIP